MIKCPYCKEEILDKNYNNRCDVDVQAQRDAWVASNQFTQEEIDEFSDYEIKLLTFESNVYDLNNVKILDAIEDLKFTVELVE